MRSFSRPRSSAFSLLEVLVAFAIALMAMVTVLQVVTSVEGSWKSASVDSFAETGEVFSTMTLALSSATLEPYQDYADSSGSFRTDTTTAFVPDHLARRSDLAFVCGPTNGANGLLAKSGRTTTGCGIFFLSPQGYTETQANSGLNRLLNALGYFVEFGNDTDASSFLLPTAQRWRWRLKQVRQPAESLQVFTFASSSAWIQQMVSSESTTPTLAENVIALVVLPERAASDVGTPLATDFRYDSRDASSSVTRHQLPARLRVALMAIDEASAQMLAAKNGTNPPALVSADLFQKSAQLDADLASFDNALTAQKIGHRLFQREILLPAAAWSDTTSP